MTEDGSHHEMAYTTPQPAPSPAALQIGLDEARVARVRARTGPNLVSEPPPPSVHLRVLAQLRDPMILLLLAAAALTITLHDVPDLMVILTVVVLNTVVGVAQEVRAEQALSALRQLSAPTARVVRAGRSQTLAAADLVPGDVVLLEAGDIVPADLSLAECVQLQVDESALTGESIAVEKAAADPVSGTGAIPRAMAYAGTVVTRGRATGWVVATGPTSALGRIAGTLVARRPQRTPLQDQLAGLGRTLAFAAVALSALVLGSGLLRGRPPGEMVLTAISLAVAAVPESLPAVITLALALGARRMARHAALVRNLPAVETLGSVTVLATDKTGTLTQNRMLAERLWLPGGEFVATGEGYEPIGSIYAADDVETRLFGSADLVPLLRDLALCNDAELRSHGGQGAEWRGDPMEVALLTLAMKGGVLPHETRSSYPRVAEVPFDSESRTMTTVHALPDGARWLEVCKGAPEIILERAQGGNDEDLRHARDAASRMADEGYRVLAVADRLTDSPEAAVSTASLRLVGLVALIDPPRATTLEAIRSIRAAGVEVVLITGDHPATARALAVRVGITGTSDLVLTGPELTDWHPSEGCVGQSHLFARVQPEQKLDIVRAYQTHGHVVAMTGDGVNDAPALRRADIGVAMGNSGTEVARQSADLVLTDDNLGSIVAAIAEGRRIYANVRTFLWYALAGGCAEILVMAFGPAFGFAVPLLPAQILWINLITHGLPGVAIGAEPPDPAGLSHGPRPPRESVLGGGLWRQILWTGALIATATVSAASWAHIHDRPWQTVTFLTLGLAQLWVAMALRRADSTHRRGPRFLDVAVLGAVLLQVAAFKSPALRDLLGTDALAFQDIVVSTAVATLPALVVLISRRVHALR